jgi:hypothetical protein
MAVSLIHKPLTAEQAATINARKKHESTAIKTRSCNARDVYQEIQEDKANDMSISAEIDRLMMDFAG